MSHDWLSLLREGTERFADVVAGADPAAEVPACPGWSVRDLAEHVGGVHRWAAHAIVHGTPDGTAEPAPATGIADWYRAQAAHLIDVLAARPAEAPAWTFGPEPRTAAFWRRRQVHEVAVHTGDALAATGRTPTLDPALAWDGVDEVATVFYPRQVRLGRTEPLPGALRLAATDAPGPAIVIGDGPAYDVRGRAQDLLLLLWHRADPAAYDVAPEAAALLAYAVTP